MFDYTSNTIERMILIRVGVHFMIIEDIRENIPNNPLISILKDKLISAKTLNKTIMQMMIMFDYTCNTIERMILIRIGVHFSVK